MCGREIAGVKAFDVVAEEGTSSACPCKMTLLPFDITANNLTVRNFVVRELLHELMN